MALSEESRRRLEELGRRLPQPLPKPEAAPERPAPKRHRIETETDPGVLFQELMQASPDGTVPPHLMERLRQLEQDQRAAAAAAPLTQLKRRQGQPRLTGKRASSSSSSRDEPDPLYVSFEQMLLENEEEAEP